MKNKVLLIDGNSIMNRTFYGIRDLTTSEGLHTNAIFGFLNIFFKTMEEEKATHAVVAFDLKGPTFRHEKFEAYKGTRKGMPEELQEQMPVIKDILSKMNIRISEIEGYEADDILGTLAKQGEREGMDVMILSGDRDMLQLASDIIKVSIPKTKGGSTTTDHYFKKDVYELYGVSPEEFIDMKGLMGDSSDNIPGVPGIGEKTAAKLIEEYHSIESIYENIDLLPEKIGKKLKDHHDIAILSKELATICTDCNTNIELSKCTLDNMFTQEAYDLFKRLEFKSFFDKFTNAKSSLNKPAMEIILINEIQALKALLNSSKEIYYYILEEQGKYHLSLTIDGKSIYYIDAPLLKAKALDDLIKELLSRKDVTKITHNLKEQLHLFELDLSVDNLSIYDLALTSYLLNPVKETYHIDDISGEIMGEPFISIEELLGKGKSRIPFSSLDLEKQKSYLCQCTQIIFQCYPSMLKQLDKVGLSKLYFDIELPLLYVLKNMESVGIKVDADQLKSYGNALQDTLIELEQKIYLFAGEEFNINSPKQLGVILFEKLGLPAYKKTKTGYSTAADVLEKLKYKHPIIEEILSYRQLSKLKSTYADGLFDYIQEDNRIHSNFNQKVTSTGRISSTEPNLQNIPVRLELGRQIRKVFIPKEGCVFIDADYSQIELRLLAHLSKDETFIDAFNQNMDIHTMTASQVFHIPYEEVDAAQRRNAKAVNFGIVYGISAFGLSEDLHISRKEASDYIEKYFTKYPMVKAFLDRTVEEAKTNGYVQTMYQRIRYIPELSSSNFMQRSFGERIAMNTPIQGSAADIIKIAMIRVYRALKENNLKSKLVLQVHDELLIESPLDEVEVVKKLLIEGMEGAAKLSVPLVVDAHVGENWYEAK